MLLVLVAAEGAPAVGTRLSLDYLRRTGGAITVTWLAADPEGAWVVTRRSPRIATGTSRCSLTTRAVGSTKQRPSAPRTGPHRPRRDAWDRAASMKPSTRSMTTITAMTPMTYRMFRIRPPVPSLAGVEARANAPPAAEGPSPAHRAVAVMSPAASRSDATTPHGRPPRHRDIIVAGPGRCAPRAPRDPAPRA
jgi:hypothetical protein